MTISIIPGLDFGVKDVPTRESLIAQAMSLKITNIPISQLDADVAYILTGENSGVSGAIIESTEVGTLWCSPAGEMFVQEDSGPVKITRRGGGWDSRRYYHQENQALSGYPYPPGTAVAVAPAAGIVPWKENFLRDGPTNMSGATDFVMIQHQRPNQASGSDGVLHGVLQETGVSRYCSWNGRGVTRLHHFGSLIYDITILQTYPFGRDTTGSVQWLFMGSNQTLTSTKIQCLLLGMVSDCSSTSDANFGSFGAARRDGFSAWNPGPCMMFGKNPGAF